MYAHTQTNKHTDMGKGQTPTKFVIFNYENYFKNIFTLNYTENSNKQVHIYSILERNVIKVNYLNIKDANIMNNNFNIRTNYKTFMMFIIHFILIKIVLM